MVDEIDTEHARRVVLNGRALGHLLEEHLLEEGSGAGVSMVSIMDGAPVALIDGVDCKEMTG